MTFCTNCSCFVALRCVVFSSEPPTAGFLSLSSHRDDNEDLDDFVVSDEEDWRTALRSLTKYDPKKYRDEEDDDDMAMEANYADIEREEKRSARIGKREDKMEELREKGLLKKGSGR